MNRKGRKLPRTPRPETSGRRGGRGGRGKTLTRTEPVSLSGINKFDSMPERDKHKSDSKIDRQLWQSNAPTQRPDEFEYVEVQCQECDLWFDVHSDLLMYDPDTNEIMFVCNDCNSRR